VTGAIALLGAECTGKSELAAALANALGGTMVPEVLRAWCDARGRTPMAHEQRGIFDAQQFAERAARARGPHPIVCDTTPLSVAIHSVYYFADQQMINEGLALQRCYAHTFVCATDVPWIADGIQRDGLGVRDAVQQLLLDTLHPHIAYSMVRGSLSERVAFVLDQIKR
jgi:nicotinamide riboside kinase